ncbi:tRNA (adenosine(37)-N6)-dimethylallyltransferase MiaA [Chryseotalea sanaruensis]|uniref:tRNA dimethylallyltransferase n=1 Tax=Chryseotalea sanaruensis TaxID=2482724 RepID=A0A401UA63_9BACT|nr:tRNA (adenosine(37)-N6)-dimethylallyltransferase MiaA [Chryseotalea sanaruensis]
MISGPTAVGKTALAIALAKQLGTEIVSADSRQVYKEMEIGTAKPSSEELNEVRHHFINSHSIHQDFNAGQYEREAYPLLQSLFKTHDHVVMVGGSGLYIKAVIDGFDEIPEVPESIRTSIEEQYSEKGIVWLQSALARLDPELYHTIDKQNPHRLIRALEVCTFTGKSIQHFRGKVKREHAFKLIKIGLEMERQQLYDRINLRMDKMIEEGLFEEAERLFPLRQLNALQTVGYQEVFDYLDGKYDRAEAVRLLKQHSRHYAKRQMTWFKRDQNVHWLEANMEVENLLHTIMGIK